MNSLRLIFIILLHLTHSKTCKKIKRMAKAWICAFLQHFEKIHGGCGDITHWSSNNKIKNPVNFFSKFSSTSGCKWQKNVKNSCNLS